MTLMDAAQGSESSLVTGRSHSCPQSLLWSQTCILVVHLGFFELFLYQHLLRAQDVPHTVLVTPGGPEIKTRLGPGRAWKTPSPCLADSPCWKHCAWELSCHPSAGGWQRSKGSSSLSPSLSHKMHSSSLIRESIQILHLKQYFLAFRTV